MSRQDWRTAPSVFRALDRAFGPFDMDVFASDEWHLCGVYGSEANDAFRHRAWGANAFVQPPFRRVGEAIEALVERVVDSGQRATFLGLANVSTKWFRRAFAHGQLLIPNRRIGYWHPDENPSKRGFDRDSIVMRFGPDVMPGTARILHIPEHTAEIRQLYAEAQAARAA